MLDPDDFDVVVLVDAPPAMRRDRLVARRGLSAADAERLIAAQLPSADKRSRSDVVLDNDTTIEALHAAATEPKEVAWFEGTHTELPGVALKSMWTFLAANVGL